MLIATAGLSCLLPFAAGASLPKGNAPAGINPPSNAAAPEPAMPESATPESLIFVITHGAILPVSSTSPSIG